VLSRLRQWLAGLPQPLRVAAAPNAAAPNAAAPNAAAFNVSRPNVSGLRFTGPNPGESP
jgi:hypothetical protein